VECRDCAASWDCLGRPNFREFLKHWAGQSCSGQLRVEICASCATGPGNWYCQERWSQAPLFRALTTVHHWSQRAEGRAVAPPKE
jgi:hypothetical protein